MTLKDYVFMTLLAVLAAFIWLRDLAWVSTSDDTLPILVALPVFFWVAMPWKLRPVWEPPHYGFAVAAVLFFLFGIALNLTLLLSIGWSLLLWSWLVVRTDTSMHSSLLKLMILPLMAFPWVAFDADRIGWWFRLSGAAVSGGFFHVLGANVTQEGTQMTINGLPISVEAACAGLNTLQSMLIAGSVVNFLILGNSDKYWWNIPVLVLMAWLANTIRIVGLTAAAILVSPEFALGTFHTWGGWAILMVMFAMCWGLFSLQEKK